MTAVGLYYSARLDATSWAEAHRTGDVPDRWPYGLDRLASRVESLHAAEPPGGLRSHLLRASRRLAGGFDWLGRPRPRGVDAVVAWDERVGVPMGRAAQVPVLTGAIWLTEADRRPHWSDEAVRQGLRRCALVWALSEAQLPVLHRRWGVDLNRLRHILFGVDHDFWCPNGDPESCRLLVVGNDRHRDHMTAVRAARLAQADVRGLRLHLVTAQSVDVPDDLGRRSAHLSHRALRAEYGSAQVCAVAVRPNLHCSGITAALEAMACARPVVVTETPGMRDYVDDGVTGILVPPRDPEAMAAAVADLMRDPDRARAMGQNGRARVEKTLNTENQAAQIADLITDAL